MKTRLLIIIGVVLIFSFLSLSQALGEITTFRDPSDLTKWSCDLLTFDQKNGNLESQQLVKKWLDACIERGLLTTEERELGTLPHRGVSSRELEHVYSYSNFDLKKTIQLINDPSYPNNVYNFVLMSYEDLNNRMAVDPEFAKLLQTEVVGFGMDEQNKGIFITVDPKYANQENFDRYEEIFRETIGDVKITFEVNKRTYSDDKKDFDFRILVFVVIGVSLSILLYYFWRKRK